MKEIEREVDLTMASMDNMERAKPSHEFTLKVMDAIAQLPTIDYWIQWTKIGIAAMVLLSLSNMVALSFLNKNSASDPEFLELVDQRFDTSSSLFSINDQTND